VQFFRHIGLFLIERYDEKVSIKADSPF